MWWCGGDHARKNDAITKRLLVKILVFCYIGKLISIQISGFFFLFLNVRKCDGWLYTIC